MFTTNPAGDIAFPRSWAERADGGIRKGRLYFVLYKHYAPGDGRVVHLNAAHWFDGKCWDVYRYQRHYPPKR